MNNITKGRLLSIVVIVLLLINIATLTMFWLKKEQKLQPPPRQQGGGPFAFLVKELALDSLQVEAYKKIRDEHQKTVEGYRSEIKKAKDALFELLRQPIPSEARVQEALNNIGEKEKAFDKVVFTHFQKVRALCNETQQKKFDEIIQQALNMGAGGHRGQGPPPRREGDKMDGPPSGEGNYRRPPPPGDDDGQRAPSPEGAEQHPPH